MTHEVLFLDFFGGIFVCIGSLLFYSFCLPLTFHPFPDSPIYLFIPLTSFSSSFLFANRAIPLVCHSSEYFIIQEMPRMTRGGEVLKLCRLENFTENIIQHD